VKDPIARGKTELSREFDAGGFGRLVLDPGAMAVSARLDFFLQVANGERARDPVQGRCKRPHALHALDQAFSLQFLQCPAHRHSADAEPPDQFGFGGHAAPRWPALFGETFFQMTLDTGERGFGSGQGQGGSHHGNLLAQTCLDK
jgi:hypothetical protein